MFDLSCVLCWLLAALVFVLVWSSVGLGLVLVQSWFGFALVKFAILEWHFSGWGGLEDLRN